MAEIIKKGKIKRKVGSDVQVLLPYTTEDQVDGLVSDLAGKIANPATKSEGNFLKWNGTAWVAADVPESGVLSVTAEADSGIKVTGTSAVTIGVDSTHIIPTKTAFNAKAESSTVTAIDGRLTTAEGKITTAEGKITTLEGKAHEHSNKTILDGIAAKNLLTDAQIAEIAKVTNKADKSYVDDELAKKVDKTQKVNGKALSGDITIYGSDIAADSSTATKLIGDDHKIPVGLLPDYILGQLLFGGSFDGNGIATITEKLKSKLGISDSTIQLINSATDDKTQSPKEYGYKTLEGVYFIADASFTIAGITFEVGDWLISTGSAWKKIDNTDAVTSVNGQTGAVVLDYEDVGAQVAFTDGSAKVADITSDVMSIYGVTQSGGAIGNGSKVGDVYTKGKVDTLLGGYVPTTTKVNGHALSSDVTVTAGDIGLSVSATDGVKLGDVTYKYSHPVHTAAAEGFYKVQVDALGHVIKTTAVAKADLTGLGVADDSLVAHLAGAETFTGKKTFTGDVELPVNVKVGSLTSTGLLKYTNGKLSVDSNNYLTSAVTKVTAGAGLTGGDITSTGTIALATSGVTAGTYSACQVDAYGRVTSGGQMIDVVSYGGTPDVVDGGWYFEENQA